MLIATRSLVLWAFGLAAAGLSQAQNFAWNLRTISGPGASANFVALDDQGRVVGNTHMPYGLHGFIDTNGASQLIGRAGDPRITSGMNVRGEILGLGQPTPGGQFATYIYRNGIPHPTHPTRSGRGCRRRRFGSQQPR